MWRASVEGDSAPIDSGQVYVLMTPMLMAAWIINQGATQLAALSSEVNWRTREVLDCATASLRACWARTTLHKEHMNLLQLVFGIPPTSCEDGLVAAGPSINTVQRLRQREVLLPSETAASNVRLVHVRQQLKLSQFLELLNAWLADEVGKPFAFYGPGNYKVDSWVFFHQRGKQLPLVVFVSSKQRSDTVDASKIMGEMAKDVFGLADNEYQSYFDFVYVYVTDQTVQSIPEDERVVVIPPQLHRAFYGSMQQLLDLSKV